MATAETVVQVCGGTVPCHFSSNKTHLSKLRSGSLSRSFIRYKRRRAAARFEVINYSDKSCNGNACQFPCVTRLNVTSNRLGLIKCNCRRAESVSGLTSEDGNGAWYVDKAKENSTINGNKPVLEFETIKESNSERADFSSNGDILDNGSTRDTLQKDIADSFEDEAWELLKESIVYYCSSPVGTIAAKDPTASNVLNYDQVFIRDFIPSGMAFLLKGDYDIVRNFILHTLQLQVSTLF